MTPIITTRISSFGPTLNNLPQYDHIPDREKTQEYPDHMIQEIIRTLDNCAIVQHVNGDPDQLKLIATDILDSMSNMN